MTAMIARFGFYPGIRYPTSVLAGYLAAPLRVGTVTLAYLLWRVVRGPKSWDGEEE